jgi:hypothetical protein
VLRRHDSDHHRRTERALRHREAVERATTGQDELVGERLAQRSARLLRVPEHRQRSYVYQGFQTVNSITQYLAPGHHYRYEVFALDNAGNLSAASVSANLNLHLTQETASTITYSSGWTLQSLAGASGGKVKYSTASGKTAKLSFTGSRIAWVTTLGSNRGKASVVINGGAPSP